MVKGGLNFKVDYKMDIKRVHRGVTMEYFNWFSWLLRCLDKSDGPRMGWYDSGIVRGGQDFKVDFKVDIK